MDTRLDLRPGLCLRAGSGWEFSSWMLWNDRLTFF